MNYQLKFNDEVIDVEINENSEGSFTADFNGKSLKLKQRTIKPGHFELKDNKKGYKVHIAQDDSKYYLKVNGNFRVIEKVIQTDDEEEVVDISNLNVQLIKAPMPGSVVKISVSEGDKVEEGQGIIIIEAMKMENVIYALFDGVVKTINTTEGALVGADEVLIEITRENE